MLVVGFSCQLKFLHDVLHQLTQAERSALTGRASRLRRS
ncbi:hypothetical protein ACZ87_02786, partial [Candidatus Erwinia dacicola]